MKNVFIFFIFLLLLSSCNWWDKLTSDGQIKKKEKTPVARVGENYLYKEDLSEMTKSANMSKEDSEKVVNRYIDSWIRNQLFLKEAETKLTFEEEEIDKKVQEYRNQLLMYAYQKQIIEQNNAIDVTEEEIKKYYEQYSKDFELKQNIVKGIFMKVSKTAPKVEQLRNLLKSKNLEDTEKYRSYAYSYADLAILNDSVWFDFQDMIANTPFMEKIQDKSKSLKTNNYFETSDNTHLYFILIKDSRVFGEISPLEFVHDQIKNILINKKRLDIINRYEIDIYEKAKLDEDYEIFK
ncbi:MAG: peptidylprolyl isomerase [Flammeovirgaceae bacterium]